MTRGGPLQTRDSGDRIGELVKAGRETPRRHLAGSTYTFTYFRDSLSDIVDALTEEDQWIDNTGL